MSNLNEEIKKIKLMMVYDNRVTLSEQRHTMINEGNPLLNFFLKGGEELKMLKSELKPFMNDFKLTDSFKGTKNIDDIFDVISSAKNAGKESSVMRDLNNVLKKQTGLSSEIKSSLSSSLRDSEAFLTKYKDEILADNIAGLKSKMKQSGKYSDEMIEQITKDLSKSEGKALAKSKIKNVNVTKEVEALKQESHISKYKDKFNQYYNNGKGRISDLKKKDWVKKGFLKRKGGLGRPIKWVISKRKILAWAAVAGVTYYILKNWLSSQDIIEETDTDDGTGDTGDTGDTGGTKYFDCNQFPYKKGCRSSIIGEVQKCLGIKVDNTFGNDTEKALKSNNYGTEITKDIYNQIKLKCNPIVQTTTTTTTTLSPEQEYGTEPTPQNTEGGTQTSRIKGSEI